MRVVKLLIACIFLHSFLVCHQKRCQKQIKNQIKMPSAKHRVPKNQQKNSHLKILQNESSVIICINTEALMYPDNGWMTYVWLETRALISHVASRSRRNTTVSHLTRAMTPRWLAR